MTQEQFFQSEAKLISFSFKGQVARQPKFQCLNDNIYHPALLSGLSNASTLAISSLR